MASATEIINMALGRIGEKRINNIETDTTVEAQQARLQYDQTRDALLRSFAWRFASTRKVLVQDTTDPVFGWENQFILPSEFMTLIGVFEANNLPKEFTSHSFQIEGERILLDQDECSIQFVEKITDTSKFTPLFTEVLVLMLAIKFVMPLSQDKVLRRELQEELRPLMSRARVVNKQEQNTFVRQSWLQSRFVHGRSDPARLG